MSKKNEFKSTDILRLIAAFRSVPPGDYWRIAALAQALDPNGVDPAIELKAREDAYELMLKQIRETALAVLPMLASSLVGARAEEVPITHAVAPSPPAAPSAAPRPLSLEYLKTLLEPLVAPSDREALRSEIYVVLQGLLGTNLESIRDEVFDAAARDDCETALKKMGPLFASGIACGAMPRERAIDILSDIRREWYFMRRYWRRLRSVEDASGDEPVDGTDTPE